MWASVYKLNKSNEIKDESLSYRAVVNDFQTQVKKTRLDARSEWVAKDIFSTFVRKDSKNETDMSNSEAEAKTKKMKKTDKQLQKSNKRQ